MRRELKTRQAWPVSLGFVSPAGLAYNTKGGMMKAIWKFAIEDARDKFEIEMPIGTEILCVQTQHEKPCIWALVDTGEGVEKESREFRMSETGHPLNDDLDLIYIGTFQILGGDLVFHVFELKS